MKHVENVQADLLRMRAEHSNMSLAVTKVMEDRVALLQSLSDRYYALQDKRIQMEDRLERGLKVSEVKSLYIKELAQLRKDETLMASLEEGVNLNKGDVMRKIRLYFGPGRGVGKKMVDRDFRLLTLLYSGFRSTAISYLMGTSDQCVRSAKKRYIQRFRQLDHPGGDLMAEALEKSGPSPGRPMRDTVYFG